MGYIRDDFSKLRWNVYDLVGEVKFPEYLILNSEYKTPCWKIIGVEEIMLVKWVVYMYDRNSPMIIIEDLRKRAITAGREAGFPVNKGGGFLTKYYNLVTFDKSIRIKLFGYIIDYCKLQGGLDYTQLGVYEFAIMNNNLKIVDPEIEPSDFKAVLAAQDTLIETTRKLKERFFQNASTPEMNDELSILLDNERLEYSPEKIAMNKEIREAIDSLTPNGRHKYQLYKESDLSPREKGALKKQLANETKEAESHFTSLKNVNKTKSKK